MDPDIDFKALFARFDTVVMGRHTYEAMASHGGEELPGVYPKSGIALLECAVRTAA
jgi:dihydrofolate reductase